MKLSTKSEYALLILIFFAKINQKKLIKAKEISLVQKIPYSYLEQLLLILKRSGYLISSKGRNGGYKLAKKPKNITIAEIIRLFDGAIAPVLSVSKYYYKKTALEREKKITSLMKHIRDYISNLLEKTTLADII